MQGIREGLHTFSGISNEDVTELVRIGQQMLFDKIKEEPPIERDVIAIPGIASIPYHTPYNRGSMN